MRIFERREHWRNQLADRYLELSVAGALLTKAVRQSRPDLVVIARAQIASLRNSITELRHHPWWCRLAADRADACASERLPADDEKWTFENARTADQERADGSLDWSAWQPLQRAEIWDLSASTIPR